MDIEEDMAVDIGVATGEDTATGILVSQDLGLDTLSGVDTVGMVGHMAVTTDTVMVIRIGGTVTVHRITGSRLHR